MTVISNTEYQTPIKTDKGKNINKLRPRDMNHTALFSQNILMISHKSVVRTFRKDLQDIREYLYRNATACARVHPLSGLNNVWPSLSRPVPPVMPL